VRAAALAIAVALVLPAGAFGARDAELSMMDDQALLGRSQAKVDQVLARMKSLGADRLRVSAFWADIAPSPRSRRRPSGFDAINPGDPRYRWASLDRVVSAAAAHGLRVLISISTPIPYWGSSRPAMKNDVWDPSPDEFSRFAYAVATRYGSVADQFALLNEPNQGAWLQPQSVGGKAVAPHLYRALVRAAYPVVKLAAPSATVLVGELAPSGRNDPGTTRPIRPLLFLRLMGCRDTRFKAIRDGRCKGFRPVPVDAIGHHPYAVFRSPFQRSPDHDDAAIGDWRRLESTLDRLVTLRALAPSHVGRLPIYYTEFGYQTDPPDPFSGIPLTRQDRWLQDAAYVAWSTPRVHALNQFRLTDGPIRGQGPLAYREFQSGLYFANGKPKPSLAGFRSPIVVRPAGRARLLVWGQARAGNEPAIVVEHRAPGSRTWVRIATASSSALGYFQVRVRRRPGSYRFQWSEGDFGGRSEAVNIAR
jgi:hypothetical protein